MKLQTSIIPTRPITVNVKNEHVLNYQAICIFSAIGFFLDDDTYWCDQKVLRPASDVMIDENGYLKHEEKWFEWFHKPKQITFDDAVDKFAQIFEGIIKEQIHGKDVILPLSGGLDSRTQAAALRRLDQPVKCYSYNFQNGYNESKIAIEIAKRCGFDIQKFTILSGYLWDCIDDLANINGCYSDFTSPRQMAVSKDIKEFGNIFSLGHWGDVLFDNYNVDSLNDKDELDFIVNKLIKPGGLKLAQELWEFWSLEGEFLDYFYNRVQYLLNGIKISNKNSRLRAFKSMFWAPRWTAINLSIFEKIHPISLPYFDDRMCRFICEMPEDYLSSRRIQIGYLEKYAPDLARITWQDSRPFSIKNRKWNRAPYNWSYRASNKLKRVLNSLMQRPYVQRNWELQFQGDENVLNLEKHLIENKSDPWFPQEMASTSLKMFKALPNSANAHRMNMLLTLKKFNEHHWNA